MDKIKNSQPKIKKELFDSFDSFFDKHLSKFFWLSFILAIIFGYLLFDIRVSLTGDDSGYIIQASRFIKNFDYPSFEGPLYPIVLAPFIWLFGINLVLLKIVSFIFILSFLFFFYKAFKNRISSFLLSSLLILISLNADILYFASQTYTEALFMLIQALLLLYFYKYFVDNDNKGYLKENYKKYLIVSLLIVLMGLTRNVGLASLPVVSFFLILNAKWRQLFYIFLSFLIFFGLFQVIKVIISGGSGLQFETHLSALLLKDYYNPLGGKEDFNGFISRLIENSNIYLSQHFFLMLGLPSDHASKNISLLAVLTYILYIPTFFLTFRKNKYLLFSALYGGIFCITTFLITQTSWGQARLIVPFLPFMLLTIFSTMYYLFKIPQFRKMQFLLCLILVILIFSSLSRIIDIVQYTNKINNKYFGLSPDWVNYEKMSEWAGKNLPKDSLIACRKPSISYICANGREFYGILILPTWSVSDMLNYKNDTTTSMFLDFSNALKSSNMNCSSLLQYIKAVLINGSRVFYMVSFPNSIETAIKFQVKACGISTLDVETVKNKFKIVNKSSYAAYPDSLLDKLKKSKVKYVLDASLRKYSNKKTGQILNTVGLYVNLIKLKYPYMFSIIFQMGDNNDEPAVLYEINYSKYHK